MLIIVSFLMTMQKERLQVLTIGQQMNKQNGKIIHHEMN